MIHQDKLLWIWTIILLGFCTTVSITSLLNCEDKRFYGYCNRTELSYCYKNILFNTTIEALKEIEQSISSFSDICRCNVLNHGPVNCSSGWLYNKTIQGHLARTLGTTEEETHMTTFTTPNNENTSYQQGTIAMCPCSCDYFDKIEYWSQEANQIKQYNELSQQLAQIKNILKMETKNLTAYLNSKKSVGDKRPSARATGYVGGVILVLILCCLVLLDILKCSH